MIKKYLLLIVLIAAFLIRIIDINNNPPSLYGDELTLAYDAYSLINTGQDQTGKFLPITFAMSEGRSPAYVYASLPFVAIFGPNTFSVRLLSVLSGVGVVLLIYLLTDIWLGRKKAIIAAFFAAVLPWDIALSRAGFETHFALLLSLLGLFSLLKSKANAWWLIISAVSFGLSIHAYHSYKISLPPFLILLAWFINLFKDIFKKKNTLHLVISSAIFIFLVGLWLSQLSQGSDVRFSTTNIFGQENLRSSIIQSVNLERNASTLPFPGLLHNSYFSYSLVVGENYLQNFLPNFLFLHGDLNPRHNPALMGELYLAQALLVLIGLVSLFRSRLRLLLFLTGWALIAAIPTALVSEPHALRSAFMIPPLLIFTAEGTVTLLNKSKESLLSRFALFAVLVGIAFQALVMTERIYFLSPNLYARFWSYPAKQASMIASDNRKMFDYVILSPRITDIEYAYPTYEKIDPRIVIGQNKEKTILQNYKFKKMDNVYIGGPNKEEVVDFIKNLPGTVMYIGAVNDQEALGGNFVFGKDQLPSLIIYTKH